MTFTRRILNHGNDPAGAGSLIDARAIQGCWFELSRTGGCGPGEVALRDNFPDRDQIDIGDWLSFEHHTGARWYLGRVEERRADSPAVVTFRLEGPAIELNEVFPGGFAGEGIPSRLGATDLFSFDPDRSFESWLTESFLHDAVTWLLDQWIVPRTHILHDPAAIENEPTPTTIQSYKWRGEESVRSILKELALLAGGASWGVDADRTAFFLQRRGNVLAEFQEGQNLTALHETRTRDFIYNRILLTGDYIYPESLAAGRPWRARWNFVQFDSRAAHGERRIRLWVPWIRSDADALNFAREFFRVYAEPTTRYELHTLRRDTLLLPWLGRVRLKDRAGDEIVAEQIDKLRVLFDHAPRFEITLGPPDPHTLWPEPPQDERWEIPQGPQGAGPTISLTSQEPPPSVSLTSESSQDSESSADSAESTGSSGSLPDSSSDNPSDYTSEEPSNGDSAEESSDGDSSGEGSSGGDSSGGGSSGAGSSGGGGPSGGGSSTPSSDGVECPCCENPIPSTLTVTHDSPGCTPGTSGTAPNTGGCTWEGDVTVEAFDTNSGPFGECVEVEISVRLVCEEPGIWHGYWSDDDWASHTEMTEISAVCDPFEVCFQTDFFSGDATVICFGGSGGSSLGSL